jgi:hypothetical protein
MTAPEPKYFEHPDIRIRHLEWEAIKMIVFDGSHVATGDAYPEFEQRQFYWIDPFTDKAKQEHHQLKRQLYNNEITSLDDFYEQLKPFLKSKPRGKLLRDKKKRTAQDAYQREQLGDAFIENKLLVAAAKMAANQLNELRANKDQIVAKAEELIPIYNKGEALSPEQFNTLCKIITDRMAKLQKPDDIESKLIDTNDKNIWFMWGKLKRKYAEGDTFTLTTEEARKLCRCSKSDIGRIMKKLCSVGALTLIQAGRAGKLNGIAALYRREA